MALACGRSDIHRFQAELDSDDLDWWLAYWNLEAFGVDDLQHARLLSALSEVTALMAAKVGVKRDVLQPSECLVNAKQPQVKRQPEMSGEDIGRTLMRAFGFGG